MKLYKLVWLYVIVYSVIQVFENAQYTLSAIQNFFKDNKASIIASSANHQSKNKNAYLILIGMGKDKYSYFYQPDSVVVSFGGNRRDIFEQSLLSLDIQRLYTIVSTENMIEKIKKSIEERSLQERWFVLYASRVKKYGTYRSNVRKVRSQIVPFNSTIPLPSTILFDIGDFSADYLRAIMQVFADSCVQYVIYHKKRPLSNLNTIIQMMERSNYRQVKNVHSQYIATFVLKTSALWKKQ